ncbi:DUF6973 domain-containing protein [Gordonia iterans]
MKRDTRHIGDAHEADGGNPGTPSTEMDLANNLDGRYIGLRGEGKPDEWIVRECRNALISGRLTVIKPVGL